MKSKLEMIIEENILNDISKMYGINLNLKKFIKNNPYYKSPGYGEVNESRLRKDIIYVGNILDNDISDSRDFAWLILAVYTSINLINLFYLNNESKLSVFLLMFYPFLLLIFSVFKNLYLLATKSKSKILELKEFKNISKFCYIKTNKIKKDEYDY